MTQNTTSLINARLPDCVSPNHQLNIFEIPQHFCQTAAKFNGEPNLTSAGNLSQPKIAPGKPVVKERVNEILTEIAPNSFPEIANRFLIQEENICRRKYQDSGIIGYAYVMPIMPLKYDKFQALPVMLRQYQKYIKLQLISFNLYKLNVTLPNI